MRRPLWDVVTRTILTALVGGAATGALTAAVFFTTALGTSGGEFHLLEAIAGTLRILFLSSLAGLFAGMFLSMPALLILLPTSRWSAQADWRARVAGVAACLLPVACVVAAGAIGTEGRDGPLWPTPAIALPVLLMAAAIGAWRGPDLLRRPG
ncbi:hypothetical protein ACIBG8_41295 [Nonomuraea sp. NPDC050556]|uniref:hypothetical protein n=1 Tax=Nonomuraea sp. NPDC050556 TaxID=3364369 RepID=UPI00378E6D14